MLENDLSVTAVGKRLRYLRLLAGLSRGSLAKAAQVTETSISYWEHGKTGLISERSINKLLTAFKNAGIESSEHWLRTGLTPLNTISTGENIAQKLLISLGEEIKIFTSLTPLTIVTKIEDSSLLPLFEQGDIVGGIWQTNDSLMHEKFCIVNLDNRLQVRLVKKETFEKPTDVAPIIRLWR